MFVPTFRRGSPIYILIMHSLLLVSWARQEHGSVVLVRALRVQTGTAERDVIERRLTRTRAPSLAVFLEVARRAFEKIQIGHLGTFAVFH